MNKSVKSMSKTPQAAKVDSLAAIAQSRWLSEFPRESLERLVAAGGFDELARGDVLCRRGERIRDLSIVIEGTLDVSVTSAAGKRYIQVYLEAGQLMNLIPVLDEQPGIHDASAHTKVTLMRIPRAAFQAEIDREPRVAQALMRVLCLRSRVLYAALTEVAFLPMRVRCARVLHSLMSQYGLKRGNAVEIGLKLSQEELADMIGRTRQSVNKELKALEREGVIRMTYSTFLIVNEAALTDIALSDSTDLPDHL